MKKLFFLMTLAFWVYTFNTPNVEASPVSSKAGISLYPNENIEIPETPKIPEELETEDKESEEQERLPDTGQNKMVIYQLLGVGLILMGFIMLYFQKDEENKN